MGLPKSAWIGFACAAAITAWSTVRPVGAQGQQGQQAPPRPPTFTQAQAAAGAAAYKQNCAGCHGAALEGEHLAPALSGERFDRTWRGRPAGSLMFQLRRMPPNLGREPGGLGDDVYPGILAYLLQSNGQQASGEALPSDPNALAALTIPRREGTTSDTPLAPVVASASGAARLAALTAVTGTMLQNPPDRDWLQWG